MDGRAARPCDAARPRRLPVPLDDRAVQVVIETCVASARDAFLPGCLQPASNNRSPRETAVMFNRCRVSLSCLVVIASAGLLSSPVPADTPAGARDGEWRAGNADPLAKLHPTLVRRLETEGPEVKAWVFFTDKGFASEAERAAALQDVADNYNPRAKQRRAMRGRNAQRGGQLFDWHDLPTCRRYIDAVEASGARLHVNAHWLNAISVYATKPQLEEIATLPFVDRLEAVARARRVEPMNVTPTGEGPFPTTAGPGRLDYGAATAQLTQINLIALHDAGYTGQGVVIGILDTGFKRSHQAFNQPGHAVNVIAEYDFVDNDPNTAPDPGDPFSQHNHGTMILGCIGAYMPGSLVGGAFDASFILCKTEDTTGEYPAEEDNYVAGLQFTELNGADMTTASLGYIDWYTQAQLDGQTAVTTIACNVHTAAGVHHTNAAGNEYHDSNPTTSHLIAPSDAFQVITCGAVSSSGSIASFSSDGPTADGRVKPEVLARGLSTHTVSPSSDTSFTTADGTSLSTPLVACAVACLVGAKPYWTVDDLRQHLFEKSDYFLQNGTHDPLFIRGYGVIDAYATYDICSDAGVIELDKTAFACESAASMLVNDCGLNTDPALVETVQVTIDSDSEPGGESVVLTETAPDSAEFLGTIPLSETDGPGILLVAHGDTVTATYIDADDGQGNTNVVVTDTGIVDCVPPAISNIHATNIEARSATIVFNADEPVRGIVHYGLACGALNATAEGSGYSILPSVNLANLQDETTYYYAVEAEDEAGNLTYDDNGGNCYAFTTPDIPSFFTELFDGSDNDLDNMGLAFTPNGSVDFYAGCAEPISVLPTDPAGGTTISLSDDDYEQVNLIGATVSLYGQSYNRFYVGSNGYITFSTGDTDTSESLTDHFEQPRISALFDDLNPASGGTVSWKQLTDRVAVTYLNVPEYSVGGSNTFQIEMHFDGKITISYLAVSASDGLAGLSDGNGVSPDYAETDLSAMGPCVNTPPVAHDVYANADQGIAQRLSLPADDDGFPIPPGALTTIVTSLPSHGALFDAGTGLPIDTTPYALDSNGNEVDYVADAFYVGPDAFQWKANDGGSPPQGGDSNTASVFLTVAGVPRLIHDFNLASDPGWFTEGQWAFGQPTGQGSYHGDPTSGYTGDHVYGYNLDGDYTNYMPVHYLTTPALGCTGLSQTELRFARWLAVEEHDVATIEVSNDGVQWTVVYQNLGRVNDSSWSIHSYDISAIADDQPTVYVRWGMGPTDGSYTMAGWNIDDVGIWGVVAGWCLGDADCSGSVDFADIEFFVAALAGEPAWEAYHLANHGQAPTCPYAVNDLNGGGVEFTDVQPFIQHLGQPCDPMR
jgi:hypothetical protein